MIGLLVALFTILITSYFQYKNHLRFKKMLIQANRLLLDYFKGFVTNEKIIELKTIIRQQLEKNYIQGSSEQYPD